MNDPDEARSVLGRLVAIDPNYKDARQRLDNVELNCVMSNSFGFGGTNATLIFKRY